MELKQFKEDTKKNKKQSQFEEDKLDEEINEQQNEEMFKLYSELGEQYLESKDQLDALQNGNTQLEHELAALEVELREMNTF